MELLKLLELAKGARLGAYAPYSNFKVGAALVVDDQRVFTGVNVENISFGLTCCAERAAVFAAISAGARKFQKILIVADSREPITPCGACRQVLAEFAAELEIISANLQGKTFVASLSELLPRAKAGILDVPHGT